LTSDDFWQGHCGIAGCFRLCLSFSCHSVSTVAESMQVSGSLLFLYRIGNFSWAGRVNPEFITRTTSGSVSYTVKRLPLGRIGEFSWHSVAHLKGFLRSMSTIRRRWLSSPWRKKLEVPGLQSWPLFLVCHRLKVRGNCCKFSVVLAV
jgi:hypothetical protein